MWSDRQEKYGRNSAVVEVTSYWRLFFEEVCYTLYCSVHPSSPPLEFVCCECVGAQPFLCLPMGDSHLLVFGWVLFLLDSHLTDFVHITWCQSLPDKEGEEWDGMVNCNKFFGNCFVAIGGIEEYGAKTVCSVCHQKWCVAGSSVW